MHTLSFLLHDQKKRNQWDSPNPLKEWAINNLNPLLYSCRALPKIYLARISAETKLAALRQCLRLLKFSLHF